MNNNTQPSTDTIKLQNAVQAMSKVAYEGLTEICALSKLAHWAMEHPDSHTDTDCFVLPFQIIWLKAEETERLINDAAIEVGYSYEGEAKLTSSII